MIHFVLVSSALPTVWILPLTILHDGLPGLASRHPEQRQHGIAKVLEVGMVIHILLKFYQSKLLCPNDRVQDQKQKQKASHTEQLGNGSNKRVKQNPKVLVLLHNFENPADSEHPDYIRRCAQVDVKSF